MLELTALAIALSMDAVAVSIALGAKCEEEIRQLALKAGGFFGVAQMVMPLLGFYLGAQLHDYIGGIHHWVALGVLGFLGLKMIHEATQGEKELTLSSRPSSSKLLLLAFATSLDAMAAGLTLTLLGLPLWFCLLFIGGCTFLLSFGGVHLGRKSGTYLEEKAEYLGGIILILIGVKIFIEYS
ncbi:manganese efflux pump MntP family protein [Wolinella succinogenes]|uniref:manganese efflux pump MntP n=1 Tax=Wolinella succinogenes TaxID=844 RepID=UPI00240A617E|nr:manganese efflux pump MntP family protein [Wolinella succinogenes]